MKNSKSAVCLTTGKATPDIKKLCHELAGQGVSVIVKSKGEPVANEDNEQVRQLRGQPGQDLFFNGWKLLF